MVTKFPGLRLLGDGTADFRSLISAMIASAIDFLPEKKFSAKKPWIIDATLDSTSRRNEVMRGGHMGGR